MAFNIDYLIPYPTKEAVAVTQWTPDTFEIANSCKQHLEQLQQSERVRALKMLFAYYSEQ